jgi:hypothetical protein
VGRQLSVLAGNGTSALPILQRTTLSNQVRGVIASAAVRVYFISMVLQTNLRYKVECECPTLREWKSGWSDLEEISVSA